VVETWVSESVGDSKKPKNNKHKEGFGPLFLWSIFSILQDSAIFRELTI
jgi:hypothetical protein